MQQNRGKSTVYQQAISAALTQELGGEGSTAKVAIGWTGTNEPTVMNWVSGPYGPTADHLIELMRNLDTLLAVPLGLVGRKEAMTTERLIRVRAELAAILRNLDAICEADDNDTAS